MYKESCKWCLWQSRKLSSKNKVNHCKDTGVGPNHTEENYDSTILTINKEMASGIYNNTKL